MAYIICEPCVDVKDTACVVVCPVDCIYEFEGEDQLYIHPEECIDCDACRPECPVDAIFIEEDVPSQWTSYIEINREAFERLSVEDAVGGAVAGAVEGAAGGAAAPAATSEAALSAAVQTTALTEDRVRRILETVEEGTLDPEVAMIQLTGVQPVAAPPPAAPAAEAAPAEVPGAEKIDPETPEEVRERILLVPQNYKEDAEPEASAVEEAEEEDGLGDEEEAAEEAVPADEPPYRPMMEMRGLGGFAVWALQPVLGALPARAKYLLEGYAGERRFSAARATWWNIGLNAFAYLALSFAWAQSAVGMERWAVSEMTNLYLLLGVTYGLIEGMARTWSATVSEAPPHRQYRGALYGWAFGWLLWPLTQAFARAAARAPMDDIQPPEKAVPGGEVRISDEMERRRRYGMAHTVAETRDGYEIVLEMPRRTPVSARPRKERLPAELPDYSLRVYVEGGSVYVEARLDDPAFADAVNRDSDFPGSFLTEFALPDLGKQARHTYDSEAKELRIYAAKANRELFLEKAG